MNIKISVLILCLAGLFTQSIQAQTYQSKKWATVINSEVTGIHEMTTFIDISFSLNLITIRGEAIKNGYINLHIEDIQRTSDGNYAITATADNNMYSIAYYPGKCLIWNGTGKKITEQALLFYF